jgi:tetratricopeptide (TPR) repeat protein
MNTENTENTETTRVESLILQGRELIQQGNLPAAIARFRLATQKDPGVSLAWNDLGVALYASKQYDRAKTAFSKALSMTPEYIDAALNYATLCRKTDRPMDAAPILRDCYQLNPGDKELIGALRVLGLNQTRPIALIMTRNSDHSTNILQSTLRELGYAAHAPDPRIVACCSTTIRLNQKSWERYYSLVQPSVILLDESMGGTELPLAAAKAKGLPIATIGSDSSDLPPVDSDELGDMLARFLRAQKGYQPPVSRVSPAISVITNTSVGARELTNLLDHLALQDVERGVFEVIVVDEGCVTPVGNTLQPKDYAYKLQILRQEKSNSAAARNLAVRNARGRWVVFYAPTAMPTPAALRQHLISQISSPKSHAVTGPTYTQPDLVNNSFRRLVEKQPIVYGHNQMIHDRVYSGSTFPNSNVSIERKHLTTVDGFDENMPTGIEESELGYRLDKQHQIKVKYNRDLYCETSKIYDVDDFLKRQSIQGWSCHYMWRKHNDAAFIHGDSDTPPHDMFFLALRLEVEQNEHRIRTVVNKLNRVCQLEMRVGESHGDEIIQGLTHRTGIHEFSRGMVVAESGFRIEDLRPRGLLHVQLTPIFLRDNGDPEALQTTIDSLAPMAEEIRIITDAPISTLNFPEGMLVEASTESDTISQLEDDVIGFVDAGIVFPHNWRENVLNQMESWPDVGVVAPNLDYKSGADGELPKETLHVYRRTLNNNCLFIHRHVMVKLDQIGAVHPLEVGSDIFFKRVRLAGFLLRHALGCVFPERRAHHTTRFGTGTGG